MRVCLQPAPLAAGVVGLLGMKGLRKGEGAGGELGLKTIAGVQGSRGAPGGKISLFLQYPGD